MEQWDGSTWSIGATPVPGPNSIAFYAMSGVSCPSPTSCFSVGTIQAFGHSAHAVALQRWDGTSWSDVATPNPEFSNLSGVSCPSTTSCFAVGSDFVGAVVDRWNGTSWSIDPGPFGISQSVLAPVACASTTNCLALGIDFSGYDVTTNTGAKNFAERWNGNRWVIVAAPVHPKGATRLALDGVSCPSAKQCFAVGGYNAKSKARAVIERWNGTGWAIVPSAAPAGATGSGLYGVSCVSATSCFAVGYSFGNASPTKPLIERWNGTRWVIVPTPKPTGTGSLNAVSCVSATSCFAVGSHTTGSVNKTLVEQWNGTRWAIIPSPNPSGAARGTILSGVSCAGPKRCSAVGSYTIGSVGTSLAEQWNGSRWAIVAVPARGAPESILSSVACPTATRCVAVGSLYAGSASKPLVEQWNGTRWSQATTPNPVGATSGGLNGVACRGATRCFAVGGYGTPSSEFTLIERYA